MKNVIIIRCGVIRSEFSVNLILAASPSERPRCTLRQTSCVDTCGPAKRDGKLLKRCLLMRAQLSLSLVLLSAIFPVPFRAHSGGVSFYFCIDTLMAENLGWL